MYYQSVQNAIKNVSLVAMGLIFFVIAPAVSEAAYSDAVLADSPTFYWQFEETSGTNADDATANNNDGTYAGTYTQGVSGLIADGGNALSLSGSGSVQGGTELSSQADISMEIWVEPSALPSTNEFVVIAEWGATARGVVLGIDENGNFAVRQGANNALASGAAASTGEVYHLVLTSGSGVLRLYVNGVESASTTFSGSSTGTDGGGVADLRFVEVPSGDSAVGFEGVVDEFAGYTSVLSAATVLDHYDAGFDVSVWNDTDWTSYDTITIDSDTVDDDLTDFPVYVDLADLSTDFWNTVLDGGDDIRVTTDANVEVPREVVFASTTLQTGELHFKASSLSSTTDSVFRVWYNGSSTIPTYTATSTFGQNNVWTNNYVGVWHMQEDPTGEMIDSTSNGATTTSFGSMTASDSIAGALGNGVNFDGADDYMLAYPVLPTTDFTFSVWIDPDSVVDEVYLMSPNTSGANEYFDRIVAGEMQTFLDNDERVLSGTISASEGFYHLVSTRDGVNINQYVNASNTGSGIFGTALSFDSCPLIIGADADTATCTGTIGNWTDGVLDEIRIASTSRSDAWISAEHFNQSTTTDFYTVISDPLTLSSAANQTFFTRDAIAEISTITITEANVNPTITASNDIRVVIATGTVGMLWDTTDTTAVIGGSALSKASSTVSYEENGRILVLDVIADFVADDEITISGLSFANFSATTTATTALSVRTGGSGDTTDEALDDKTVAIRGAQPWNPVDWGSFNIITIDSANIDEDLTDFPVYVDLADLSTNFWNVTPTSSITVGTDIRVTTDAVSPVELPRELVTASSTAQTGELHFKANFISSTTDTVFRIYYNGTTTGDYLANSVHGAQNVWTNNYIAVWHMNEGPTGSVGDVLDSTGNAYHATSTGGMAATSSVAGQMGNALEFDGINDYLDAGSELDLVNSFTVSTWISAQSDNGSQVNTYEGDNIVFKGGDFSDPPYNKQFTIHDIDGDGQDRPVIAWYSEGGVENEQYSGAGDFIEFDQWYFAAARFDGTNLSLNKDNSVVVGPSSLTNPTADLNPFRIGYGDSLGGWYDGYIDEMRIASTSRSAAWIKAEYFNQSTTTDFYTAGDTAAVTLSGTLYSDAGVTPITTTRNISVAVDTSFGVITYGTSTDSGSGNYTLDIPSAYVSKNTTLVTFVDNDAGTRAVVLTKASSSENISSLDLYENRVIVRQESGASSTRNLDLAVYDSADDTDLEYSVVGGPYDPSSYTAGTSIVLDISEQETFPTAMLFNDDGTILYVMGQDDDDINAYPLPTPYDISSYTVGTSIALDVGGQESAPQAMLFNNDGTTLYVMGTTGDDINAYPLPTPYDISSYTVGTSIALDVSGEETSPQAMLFNNDGTTLYVMGTTGDDINAYPLPTPYDISSYTTGTSIALDVSGEETSPQSMLFNNDGTILYVMGQSGDDINAYPLPTPYDISSYTSGTSIALNVITEESNSQAILFNDDGTTLYVMGTTGDDINAYPLTASLAVSEGNALLVWTGTTFVPDGPVTLGGNGASAPDGDIHIDDNATLIQSQTITVAGNWQLGTNASFVPATTSSVVFNATTTGKTIEGGNTFSTVTFDGSGGAWSFNDAATTSDLTITTGTVTAPASTLTITGDYINNGTFTNNDGEIRLVSATSDINTASFDSIALDVSGEETSPQAMIFNDDGTILYVMGDSGDDINAYPLPTPYDISSYTVGTSITLDVSGEEFSPTAMLFNNDGTTLYVMGATGDDINAYPLNTAYDIGSGTSSPSSIVLDVSGRDIEPHAMLFNNDGTILYVMGNNNDNINAYPLPTPYDISSFTAGSSVVLSLLGQETSPRSMLFNNDGTILYVMGQSGDDINAYPLPTPYDISSYTSGTDVVLDVSGQESDPTAMLLNDDGTILYVMGSDGDDINAYNVFGTPLVYTGTMVGNSAFHDVTVAAGAVSFANNASTSALTVAGQMIPPSSLTVDGNLSKVSGGQIRFSDNETSLYLTGGGTTVSGNFNDNVSSFDTLTVNGSVTLQDSASTTDLVVNSGGGLTLDDSLTIVDDYTNNGTFTSNGQTIYSDQQNDVLVEADFDSIALDVGGQESAPQAMLFNNDGTTLYVMGTTGDDINAYPLPTPYDISSYTVGTSIALDVSGEETSPQAMLFNNDGTTLYVMGTTGDDINAYPLPTPYDISSYTTGTSIALDVSGEETSPQSMLFNNDGTILYVMGQSGDDINAYPLPTPYDISSYTSGTSIALNVITEESNSQAILFNDDGTTLYVMGTTGDDINAYPLPTPYDISSYTTGTSIALDVGSQESTPQSMLFNNDGTILYVMGDGGDDINVYYLAVDWSGSLTASSALGNLTIDGQLVFKDNASTSDITIVTGSSVTFATSTTVAGNYTNNGTAYFVNDSLVTLSGTSQQTATGSMTGTNAFANLTISNTSGTGSSTQSVVFNTPLEATGVFTMVASTSAAFKAEATSTFASVDWDGGTAATPVWLRSTNSGTPWFLDIETESTPLYVNVQDSDATLTSGGVNAFNSSDSGNNTNWTFTEGVPPVVWNATDWTLYDTITIDSANIDEDLTDFPVYVDLSDLSTQFWNTTPTGSTTVGADIRVTTDDGSPVELPRELVVASSTTQTGELHFKANTISSTTDTVFRIYYNGTTTSDYPASATYGAENVWSEYGFVSHDGGATDSVGNSTSTLNGGMTAGSISGQMGVASTFDGNDYIETNYDGILGTATRTVSIWFKTGGSAFQNMFGYGSASGADSGQAWRIAIENGVLSQRVYGGTSSWGSGYDDDVWHQVVMTHGANAQLDDVRAYIDGTDLGLGSGTQSINTASEIDVSIGINIQSAVDAFMVGEVDEIRVYSEERTAAWISAEYLNQSTTTDFYNVIGSPVLTLANHLTGQVDNAFSFQNDANATAFAFEIGHTGAVATATEVTLRVSEISKQVSTSSIQNLSLYIDNDDDAAYDVTDTLLDSAGVFSIVGATGTIVFSTDFAVSATSSYVVTFDTDDIDINERITLDLAAVDIELSDGVMSGSVDSVVHSRTVIRSGGGSGSSSGSVGGDAPVGDGDVGGGSGGGGGEVGEEADGDNIAADPEFNAPSETGNSFNSLTNPANAYVSDGTDATAAATQKQSYGNFGLSIPSGNEIAGISVKVDASATDGAGSTVDVTLSYDGGTTETAERSTGPLTTSDVVYIVGGSGDTWGRSWSPSELNDGNFEIIIEANPGDVGQVDLDAIQVKVYHQATGGGGGGGGAI